MAQINTISTRLFKCPEGVYPNTANGGNSDNMSARKPTDFCKHERLVLRTDNAVKPLYFLDCHAVWEAMSI